MRRPSNTPNHQFAPRAWRGTPSITGDYDMDASIMHCRNKSVPSKLKMYLSSGSTAYGERNDYNSYGGYKGDN